MARETKFGNMLSENDKTVNTAKIPTRAIREAKKKLAAKEKELEKKEKLRKKIAEEANNQKEGGKRPKKESSETKNTQPSTSVKTEDKPSNFTAEISKADIESAKNLESKVDTEQKQQEVSVISKNESIDTQKEENINKTKQALPMNENTSNSNNTKTSKIDLSELKKAQEALKKEQGFQDVEIDYTYHREKSEEEVVNVTTAETETKTSNEESQVDTQTSVTSSQSLAIEPTSQEPKEVKVEEKKEEIVKPVVKEAPKTTSAEHVSHISKSELEELKKQLARERGEEIPETNYVYHVEKKEEVTPKAQEQTEETSASSEKGENTEPETKEETALVATEKVVQNKKEEKKKAVLGKTSQPLPPNEALPDDLSAEDFTTDEETQEEEEEENYEGLTEEEIAERKERKRKLKELREMYKTDRNVQQGDSGEYKKNLDFSINTSIKRFRVKPPKKPIIISIVVVLLVLIGAGVGVYFIMNKPPEPIVIVSLRLSQTKTTQRVDEEVDIRGLYLTCEYSDYSTKTIKVTKDMITRTSANISSELIISKPENNKTTYVYFVYEGIEAKLDITVSEISVVGISAEICGENFTEGSTINYSNILVLTSTNEKIGQENVSGACKVDSSNVIYKVGDVTLEKSSLGVVLSDGIFGETTLTIIYEVDGESFDTTVTIQINEAVEEPQEPEVA